MSTNTISNFASGLAYIAADSEGIIIKRKDVQLEGTSLAP